MGRLLAAAAAARLSDPQRPHITNCGAGPATRVAPSEGIMPEHAQTARTAWWQDVEPSLFSNQTIR